MFKFTNPRIDNFIRYSKFFWIIYTGSLFIIGKDQIYFNRKGTLPFIARNQGDIVGYMIGVPLEMLSREPWARLDENFNKGNTIYTYAFVVENDSKATGCAKILKRVFLNQTKKQDSIHYITGHVREGIASRFSGEISIIDRIENWQGTGKTFEYYRRNLN